VERCCRYFFDGALGDAGGALSVWAPTAQNVELLTFEEARGGQVGARVMHRGKHGVWHTPRPTGQLFYLYRCAAMLLR
jgi:hypothetical protein